MILDEIIRYFRWQKAIDFIKVFPQKPVICDIGCGANGEFFNKISNLIKAGFGFDKKVNFYENSRIKLKKLDLEMEEIPLKEETIDIVTMMAVLEHLKEVNHILKEIFRILKPNGNLILTTPSSKAKSILEFLAKLNLIDKEAILEHKNYYSSEKIKSLLLKTGFQKENIKIKYFEFGFNISTVAKK